MSIGADQQSKYWSKVASKYDYVVDLQIGGKTRSLVRDRLAKEKRLGTLVEFGCGTGFYTAVLAEKADNVVATDISPGMFAAARGRSRGEDVKFKIQDCQQQWFPDAGFGQGFP